MEPEQRAPAPSTLGPVEIAYLRRDGAEVPVSAGEAVVRRGDPGTSFWAVLEGELEVRLTGDDGVPLPLARLGAGACFGEMALLTGDPVSADVVALTPSRLLRYPGELFPRALGASASLRACVLARLARSLRGTSAEAWSFHQRAKALNVVLGPPREEGPIVAESGAMRAVPGQVARFGADGGPLLVTGPAGAGKRFLAAKVHEASGGRAEAFIAVDCRALPAREAMAFLFGSPAGLGDGRDALRRCGALELARGGTLVLRHAERLPPEVQREVARALAAGNAGAAAGPAARVVATSRLTPEAFAGAVAGELAAALRDRAIVLPALAERRRDVVALARLFLAQAGEGGAERTLGRDAEHALVSLRYAHRNAAELREAVGMAALIADGPRIGGEHVFAGPKGEGTVHEVDLGAFAPLGRLLAPRAVAGARAAVLAVFAAIVAAGLLGPATSAGALANALTWSVWEPGLFLAFLLLGRVWCTVCPLSTAGRLAARVGCLGLTPGPWIKRRSAWIVSLGFLAIVLAEHAFGVTREPRAAAGLLLALFGAAIAFALVYRREAWCRYACPLGNLGAVYALPAVLSVRANADVCATSCTTHECFKGSADAPGCPVFHHPLYASEAHSCKLCLRCLRACPHGSARLRLRAPLQALWAQAEVGDALVPFALFLVFFAPAMLASQGAGAAASLPGLAGSALLALLLAAAARPALPRLLAGPGGADPSTATRAALALLVLAWGPAMAFQLGHVPALSGLRLAAVPGGAAASLLPGGGIALRPLAQAGVTLLAALGAAVGLAGVRSRQRREGAPAGLTWGWAAVAAFGLLYLAGALALIAAQAAPAGLAPPLD